MSIFQPNIASPINNLSSTTYHLNFQDTVANRVTQFGTINPNDYLITRYFDVVNFPKVNNKTKNIRLTLSPDAIRGDKFDFYSGIFDAGYPINRNKTFCGDKLSTVFNTGASYWTKSFSTKYSYPIVSNYGNVSAIALNICNDEPPCDIGYIYDATSEGCVPCNMSCGPGQISDPGSCLCVDPPECRIQLDCPPITIPAIKNTIQGYAFYLDAIRDINIPGVDPIRASCSGGHVCCRTLFRPRLVKSNNTEILANRNICMDNVEDPECPNDGDQIPAPGFTPITDRERSDTFTITLDNPLDVQGSSFYLNCEYEACHNGVTFVILVAELASSTDKIVIFASCVSPGPLNGKLIGTVDCPGEEGPCGDYAYSCYDGLCKNIIDMGGNLGEGLWFNDQYCGGQCEPTTPTPSPIPTSTPTPGY